jgi:hypothetical protein
MNRLISFTIFPMLSMRPQTKTLRASQFNLFQL